MNVEFLEALKDLEKERNISADIILDAIDASFLLLQETSHNL